MDRKIVLARAVLGSLSQVISISLMKLISGIVSRTLGTYVSQKPKAVEAGRFSAVRRGVTRDMVIRFKKQ